MTLLDVRRLAAIDLHGSAGSPVRRRVILAEFVLGTIGCLALGGRLLVGAGVRSTSCSAGVSRCSA